jgi:Ferritin-like domain
MRLRFALSVNFKEHCKMKTEVIERIVNSPSDRRKFLKQVGVTSIGVAAATMVGGSFLGKAYASTAITDTDILNFALNLEYLEAEFYSMSTYGSTLLELGVLTAAEQSGPTTGGNMVPDFGASPLAFLATALRETEIDHVQYLRTTLGSAAVKKPTINLAALGYGFSSVNSWLELARQFEDVGVSAYLGAAPSISSKTYLAAAGAILSTEAQHSGSLRLACIDNDVTSPAVDSLDIPPTQKTPSQKTPLRRYQHQCPEHPRTTAQVLNIVYHGGQCSGGFYPDGMNGTIICQ